MLVYFAIAVVFLLACVFFFLLYSGFFYTYRIRCTVPASLPSSFAYVVHTGPYKNVGAVFWKLNQITPNRTLFGVYYDDPQKVPAAQLRSIVGVDLATPLSNKQREVLEKHGYNFSSFPECRRAIVTEFPFRNYLSIWIAVRRVYPSLMQYIKENKVEKFGPCLEIYKNDAIQFVVILQNNEGFYVPEVSMEQQPHEDASKKTK